MTTRGRFLARELSARQRTALWSLALALLLVPLIAMQFTTEVDWGAGDFLVMGAMLAALCGIIELAARSAFMASGKLAIIAIAVLAFLLLWGELAVGIFN